VKRPSRKNEPQPTFTEIRQFRSSEEIDQAVAKLQRRQAELGALWDDQVHWDDPRVMPVKQNIVTAILDIFGPNSPEYGANRFLRIWHGPERIGQSDHENQAGCTEGIRHTNVTLQGLIERLQEKRSELSGSRAARSISAFEHLDLHPRIASAATELYRDGHYRQAVLDASIALVNFVKDKSRRHDLDGATLMRTVFSPNNPIVAFNDLNDQSARDEQEGLMHLFEGAVLALRNPRAHSISFDSPDAAVDYIAFLSLLAKRLDEAQRATVSGTA